MNAAIASRGVAGEANVLGRPEQIVLTLHRASELGLLPAFYEASENGAPETAELLDKIRALVGPCLYPEAFAAARIARCPSVLARLLRASGWR